MAKQDGTVTIENAQIIFRNFEGKESQFNAEGDRNFGVILDGDTAAQLDADGWNVKMLKPREDDPPETEPTPWLPVKVGYKGNPPRIVQLTESGGRTNLDEHNVATLDWVDIATDERGRPKVDLIVRPYAYDVNGKQGIKAYLQAMYITIEEDELQRKYADLEQS